MRAGSAELGHAALEDGVVPGIALGLRRIALSMRLAHALDHVGCHRVAQQAGQIRLVEPWCRLRVGAALGRADVRHDVDLVLDRQRDQLVAHFLVAHEMREAVDAGFRERDRIIVIEDVGGHLEAGLVRLVDHGTRDRDRQPGRAAAAVVNPDLDGVDLLGGELAHVAARLLLGGDLVGEIGVDRIARAGVGRPHAAAGEHEASAAKAAFGLLGADLVHDLAALDALRHHRRDAEIERAIEIIEDVLALEVLGEISQPALEARMHMGGDEGRHDGLARKVDPRRTRRRRDLTAAADARDGAALN